MLAAWGPCP